VDTPLLLEPERAIRRREDMWPFAKEEEMGEKRLITETILESSKKSHEDKKQKESLNHSW